MLVIASLVLLLVAPAAATERRCGWLHNPTPGNWSLVDRDGEWTLATQGSEGVPGWTDLAATRSSEWVETNGHYGHGCACATVRTDRARGEILAITRLDPRPLRACRTDRRLPRP